MAKLASKVASKKAASKSLYAKAGYTEVPANAVPKTPAQIEIAKLQQQKRDEIKRITDKIRTIRLAEKTGDIEASWSKLEEIKQLVKERLVANGLSGKYDLKKLANKVPDYYIYQHPTNKILKSADKNAAWVVAYCKKGSIDTLIRTADESRNAFFIMKTTKTKKRAKKEEEDSTTTDTAPRSGA